MGVQGDMQPDYFTIMLQSRDFGIPESPEIPVPNPDFRDSVKRAPGLRDFGIDESGSGFSGLTK